MNQNSRIEELVGDSVLVFSAHTKKNQFPDLPCHNKVSQRSVISQINCRVKQKIVAKRAIQSIRQLFPESPIIDLPSQNRSNFNGCKKKEIILQTLRCFTDKCELSLISYSLHCVSCHNYQLAHNKILDRELALLNFAKKKKKKKIESKEEKRCYY